MDVVYTAHVRQLQQLPNLLPSCLFFRTPVSLSCHCKTSIAVFLFYTALELYTTLGMASSRHSISPEFCQDWQEQEVCPLRGYTSQNRSHHLFTVHPPPNLRGPAAKVGHVNPNLVVVDEHVPEYHGFDLLLRRISSRLGSSSTSRRSSPSERCRSIGTRR